MLPHRIYVIQRNISSIEQFASLHDTERRKLVRALSDEEYSDLLAVCAMFPRVAVSADTQGTVCLQPARLP